jgi:hypothetical protein
MREYNVQAIKDIDINGTKINKGELGVTSLFESHREDMVRIIINNSRGNSICTLVFKDEIKLIKN